jgi:tRNA pseudouridine38-40 synthase
MRNIKLIVAYDGTDFCGWQFQPAVRTVQGILTDALRKILHEQIVLTAASRTDAGVHAYGQTVNFYTGNDIDLGKLIKGTNSRSPGDISVWNAEEADEEFHSTYDAIGKHYRYTIWKGIADNPLTRRFHWWYTYPVDTNAINAAARHMTGTHDFRGLQVNSGKPQEETVRSVSRIQVTENAEQLYIDVFGKGFMYKQVRSMAGLIMAAGRGKVDPDMVPAIISGEPVKRYADVAPPQGLTLMKVYYTPAPELEP